MADPTNETQANREVWEGLTKEQKEQFSKRLDAIHKKIKQDVKENPAGDREYLQRLLRIKGLLELQGRTLIYGSVGPVSFFSGVVSLALHKVMEFTHMHNVMHRQYTHIDDERFQAETYVSGSSVHQEHWQNEHNIHHHRCGVLGEDTAISHGQDRLHPETPWKPSNLLQAANWGLTLLAFDFMFGLFESGVMDYRFEGRFYNPSLLKDHSEDGFKVAWEEYKSAVKRKIKKDYIFHPLLGGILAPKILLGNYLSDVVMGVIVLFPLLGAHLFDEAEYCQKSEAGKGSPEWKYRQIAATSNFRWPKRLSVVVGHLDKHIEHHLFVSVPGWRAAEYTDAVRDVIESFGLHYNQKSLLTMAGESVKRLLKYSLPVELDRVRTEGM